MASSRLEKVGTIFSRISGLMRTGALKHEDRPLWYDVYKAFPPTEEPRFDRPAPDIPIKRIFYKEDNIRAQFHNKVSKNLGAVNLSNNETKTATQHFLRVYNELSVKSNEDTNKEEFFDNVFEVWQSQRSSKSKIRNELKSEPTHESKPVISIENVFKIDDETATSNLNKENVKIADSSDESIGKLNKGTISADFFKLQEKIDSLSPDETENKSETTKPSKE